jgi:putative flippase GtrA
MKKYIQHRTTQRFLRYFAVGGSTFLFDILLLVVLTKIFNVNYIIATAGAFMVAVSINYFISRKYVFKFTDRKILHGYLYFLIFAGLGAVAVTAGTVFLTEVVGIYFVLSRIIVSSLVGLCNYLFNLHHNFKVAGRDLH